MEKALILIAAILLAGCGHISQPVEDPRQIWCDHNSPRRHTPAVIEAMSRAELDETNAHNAKGEKWCGWRP